MVTIYPSDGEPITIAEGSNVTLRCEATGSGALNYQWKRESGSLPKDTVITNIKGGKNLIIHNITVNDSGQYYCEVDNGGDGVSSKRVIVIVKSKSQIIAKLCYT